MTILKPANRNDRLRDFIKRLPKDKKIALCCHAGYEFKGTVKQYIAHRKDIKDHHFKKSRERFFDYLSSYRRSAEAHDKELCMKLKKKTVGEYEYVIKYKPLDERKVIEAYTMPSDPDILVFHLEGEEYSMEKCEYNLLGRPE